MLPKRGETLSAEYADSLVKILINGVHYNNLCPIAPLKSYVSQMPEIGKSKFMFKDFGKCLIDGVMMFEGLLVMNTISEQTPKTAG